MKKLVFLVAMLAMALVGAAPAMAQVGQEGEQEGESGDVGQSFTVASEGGNANQCAPILGGAQTGNSQNQIGVTQYDTDADDLEFEDSGSTLTLTPEQAAECEQAINQAAAASPAKAEEKQAAPTPKATASAPKAAPAPKAATAPAAAPAAKAGAPKQLPKTGGDGTTLLTLGIGVSLMAGGLLVRRIFGQF